MKHLFLHVALAVLAFGANAATITHKPNASERSVEISIDGSVASADAEELTKLLTKYPKYSITVSLSSSGGEIDSAMKIGRLLRAREATVGVWSGQCLSSCVLIYSSGVRRHNAAELAAKLGNRSISSTGIGVHRFYFAQLSPNATTSEISTARNRLKQRIRDYLDEMNVSHQLLDVMESTPPEQMKVLRLNELYRLGLTHLDPVYDEKVVAHQAAFYQLSSAEFRKREAAAIQHCAVLHQAKMAKSSALADLDFDCEPNFIRSGKK